MKKEREEWNAEKLSDKELFAEIRKAMDQLKSFDLDVPHLPRLINLSSDLVKQNFRERIGTQKKVDPHFITDAQDENFYRNVWQQVDPLNPENLIEALSHYYQTDQQKGKNRRCRVPMSGDPEYQALLRVMVQVGDLAREVRRRFPKDSLTDHLPVKMHGEWIS